MSGMVGWYRLNEKTATGNTTYSDGAGDNSGRTAKGVWNVPGGTPLGKGTSVASLTPERSEGSTVSFRAVFTGTAGFAGLSALNLLINNAIDGRNACYLAYVRSINTLVLENDAGDAGGPFAGALTIPGRSGSIANGQCTINAAGSNVTPAERARARQRGQQRGVAGAGDDHGAVGTQRPV